MKRDALTPVSLAKRQLELDRARTARFPDLLERKLARMRVSPHAFLRGAAPLFYELLAARPELAEGPEGEGWTVGDLHLENFGAYRPDPLSAEAPEEKSHPGKKHGEVTFNLNDFDDALLAPWRLDVLRLTTSLILSGRELGADGAQTLGLCDRLLDAYVASAFSRAALPDVPPPVHALTEQVHARPRLALLDARTKLEKGGKRRFVRGPRYAELPADVTAHVPAAFAKYVKGLAAAERPSAAQLEILDVALRIAGTGSLGGLRVAVLASGKGEPDGASIFDMKEQGTPSGAVLSGAPKMDPAERVATAFRECLARPPRLIGTTELAGISMFVRKLAPQEDKLNLRGLRGEELGGLASYLGALLGCAHARGAKKEHTSTWSKADCRAILERAIEIAGIHEAVYLALCQLTREGTPAAAT